MDTALKQELRREARIRRKSISPELARQKSEAICRRLADWTSTKHVGVVHTFLPMVERGEPDINPFIGSSLHRGVRFIVPEVIPGQLEMAHHWYVLGSELRSGHWGVDVPHDPAHADPSLADVVLVPLLVADVEGYRIGYGKGYYDYFLAGLNAVFVGICYDDEIVDAVPHEPHDIPVHYIITDARLIETGISR